MKTTKIILSFIGIMTVLNIGIVSTANAYEIQSSSLNFNNFNVASGFGQLTAPFQNFIANIRAAGPAITADPAGYVQSTTLPYINADAQNYLSQASDWFYRTVWNQVSRFIK